MLPTEQIAFRESSIFHYSSFNISFLVLLPPLLSLLWLHTASCLQGQGCPMRGPECGVPLSSWNFWCGANLESPTAKNKPCHLHPEHKYTKNLSQARAGCAGLSWNRAPGPVVGGRPQVRPVRVSKTQHCPQGLGQCLLLVSIWPCFCRYCIAFWWGIFFSRQFAIHFLEDAFRI